MIENIFTLPQAAHRKTKEFQPYLKIELNQSYLFTIMNKFKIKMRTHSSMCTPRLEDGSPWTV